MVQNLESEREKKEKKLFALSLLFYIIIRTFKINYLSKILIIDL